MFRVLLDVREADEFECGEIMWSDAREFSGRDRASRECIHLLAELQTDWIELCEIEINSRLVCVSDVACMLRFHFAGIAAVESSEVESLASAQGRICRHHISAEVSGRCE